MRAITGGVTVDEWARGCRVESRLGTRVLARDIPVLEGEVTLDARRDIVGELSLTVPRSWTPEDEGAPLATWGQELHVYVTFTNGDTTVEVPYGVFIVYEWQQAGDLLRVRGKDRWAHLYDAPAPFPRSPQPGVTVENEARALATPVPVKAPSTGVVHARLTWGNDRCQALRDLGARYGVYWLLNGVGEFETRPMRVTTVDTTVTDATAVINAVPHGERDQITEVIAWSQKDDVSPVVSATAYNSHPRANSSLYGVRREIIAGDPSDGYGTLNSLAYARVNELGMRTRTTPYTLVPDARLELYDTLAVEHGGQLAVGRVVGLVFPLTVGAPMRVDLAEEK